MADIIITCQNCGNQIPVSEFVDANLLTCMKCKARVTVPPRNAEPQPSTQRLRLAVEKAPEPPPAPATLPERGKKTGGNRNATQPNDVRQYLPKPKKRKPKRRAGYFETKVMPWLLFIVLSLVLGWLRYFPDALPADTLNTLISGGVWMLVLIHLAVICLAFGDDSFYGILCLIIPGYSLYYLYMQADQMAIRSVMGALMIAFGWDAVIATRQLWAEVYTTVSIWIATTDSVKK